jgi:hypothetical protein
VNEDDLYEPRLTAPPGTSPLVRGAALAMVVGAAMAGCTGPANPGTALDSGSPGVVFDGGISIPPDSGSPGVDTGSRDTGPRDTGPDVSVGPDAFVDVDSGSPGAP